MVSLYNSDGSNPSSARKLRGSFEKYIAFQTGGSSTNTIKEFSIMLTKRKMSNETGFNQL